MTLRTARAALTAFFFLSLAAETACAENPGVVILRAPNGGIQPQTIMDERGTLHLIYFKGEPSGGDIFYVRRPPGRNEFSSPIQINTQPCGVIATGAIRGAQLALGRGGRVHVAWNGHAPANGAYLQAPMFYTRLGATGTAFEPERNVITSAGGLDGGGSVAADAMGNVYVLWHAPKPGARGEDQRAVFVAKSADDGKTFAPEIQAISEATGACGCCGMKAFVDGRGDIFALYRAAWEMTNRDETLLMSRDHGRSFQVAYQHGWKIGACPMSSAFLSQNGAAVLAAAETHERVYYVQIDPNTGKVSAPVCPEGKGKHPVAIANRRGQVLLAWTEDASWGKGGAVAWQIFGSDGAPISERGHSQGLPAWSLVAAAASPEGAFTIIY